MSRCIRVALGVGPAGLPLKDPVRKTDLEQGNTVLDPGTFDRHPVDHPDIAGDIAHAVATGGAERGILIRGSEIGASVAGNPVTRPPARGRDWPMTGTPRTGASSMTT